MAQIKIIYTEDGQEYTLKELSIQAGVTLNKLRHLYYKCGSPKEMTPEMIFQGGGRGGGNAVEVEVIDDRGEDHKSLGKMSLQDFVNVCNAELKSDRPYMSYSSRWSSKKKPTIVYMSEFLVWKYPYRGTIEKQDDDLPHITRGDLAHLSNRERCPGYTAKPGKWEVGLCGDDNGDIFATYPSGGRVISR